MVENLSNDFEEAATIPTMTSSDKGSTWGPSQDQVFQSQATEVLSGLRLAVEKAVYSVTRTLPNSRSLVNSLGIDLKTSYQIFKMLGSTEPLAAVQFVPATISYKKLLVALKKQGSPELLLKNAFAAYEQFQKVVEETTGDLDSFETAVMSYADVSESSQVSMAHRKSAFKSDVFFHGVSLDTLSLALLFHPGREPETYDFLGIRHMLGLRRLRAGTDLDIDRWRFAELSEQSQNLSQSILSSALDEKAALKYDAAVLPDFCSKPILPMETVRDSSGAVKTKLKHHDLSVGKLVDVTTARILPGERVDRTADGRALFTGLVEIGRPTRLQIVDVFVHRLTWPNLIVKSGVFAHYMPRQSPSTIEQDSIRLPFAESLTPVDRHAKLRSPEVPRLTELLNYGCEQMGWRLDEMDAFRFRIEFPLLYSNIQIHLEVEK